MSRVNFDATFGWVPRESPLPGANLWDQVPQSGSFDEHLQQAQSTSAVAANDNRREPADTEAASQPPRSPEDRRPAQAADAHAAGQSGDPPAAADSDVNHGDEHAARPSPGDSGSNRPATTVSPRDQSSASESQEDAKQHPDAPREGNADTVHEPGPDAAKVRPKKTGNKRATAAAASSDAAARPAATHKKAVEPEESSEAKAVAPAPQGAEQADAGVRATSAGQQVAEDLAASSEAREPRAGKTGKAAAELRKAKANVEKGVEAERQTTDSAGAAGTAEPGAKPSTEAAQASDETSGEVVLQERAGDAEPSPSTARRAAPRSSPRGVNDSRPADNQADAAAGKDAPRLAAEMPSAISVTAEIDPPPKRGETPGQTSPPSQAGSPASVPSTDGVLTRSQSAASRPSRSAAPAEDSPSDAAERVQFAQRVARAFAAAADRGGAIRLRLHPPELGSLRLELTVRNGAMTARLETETESARTMLLDNLPALKERLAEHQIKVDRFDVDWRAQPQGNLPQGSGEHSRWQPPAADPLPGAAASSRREPSAEPLARTPARPNAETSFDVVI